MIPGIIGQERVCRTIERLIAKGRYAPLLFVGPPGVGKRTIAFKFAQALNCEKPVKPSSESSTQFGCGICPSCRAIARLNHPDFRLLFPIRKPRSDMSPEDVIIATAELSADYILGATQPIPDPTHQISIQAVRWLRMEMAKPPSTARVRFFVLLNAHQMKDEAQNALLKILEEPQINTILILTTSVPNALLDTIRSRCQIIRFAEIPESQILNWLRMGIKENRRQETELISFAAALAQGSLGRALMILNNPEPEEFIIRSVLEKLTTTKSKLTITQAVEQLKNIPLTTIVNTLIFLYRSAFRSTLTSTSTSTWTPPSLLKIPPALILKRIRQLYTYQENASLNTNPLLTLHTLIFSICP
ncbi:MAG: hypothetical protein ABIK18_00125 [candidate division WOR-3 bacterium]